MVTRTSADPSDAAAVLSAMARRGVNLWMDGSHLRYQAPAGVMRPEDIEKLTTLKQEICALLVATQRSEIGEIPPLRRRPPHVAAPLTFAQQFAWLSRNFAPSTLIGTPIRAIGPLSVDCLHRALRAIFRRHELLRTRIICVDGNPMPQVDDVIDVPVEVIHLTEEAPEARELAAKSILKQCVVRHVDYSTHPAFAAILIRLTDQDHVLIVYRPSELTDAFSLAIMWRDIWTFYAQAARGNQLFLPEVPIQLADYATWERETNREWKAKHDSYWRERLDGARGLQLFAKENTGLGRKWTVFSTKLDSDLLARLQGWSKKMRTTVMMSFLAAYVALVARWSGRMDLLIWVPVYGRFHPGLESTVGSFSFPLALRLILGSEDNLLDLLDRVVNEYSNAYEHHDVFRSERVTPELMQNTGLNWVPGQYGVDPVMHLTQSGALDGLLKVSPFEGDFDIHDLLKDEETYDPMYLFMVERDAEMIGTMLYRADCVSTNTIKRFWDSLMEFVRTLMESPSAHVVDMRCLD